MTIGVVLRVVFAGLGVALASAVLLVTVISLLPGHSWAQERAGIEWTNQGPRIAVVAVVAVILACVGAPTWRSRVVLAAVTGLAVVGASVQLGRVVTAVHRAGGSIDLVSVLRQRQAPAPEPDVWAVYRHVDGQDLRLAIWKPDVRNARVIFAIHGGGWFSGQATDEAPDAAWWTARGWLVVSVDYRLADKTHATWDKAPADVADALRWTTANVARYGGDPGNIIVMGGSAGGNLAINLAYSTNVAKAVVASVPVVDPQDAYDHGVAMSGSDPKEFIGNYLGGAPARYPDRLRAISSATYIGPGAPPTLIIEPEEDGFIPSEGVFAFADRARKAGVDMTIVRLPVVNHFSAYADSLAGQANRTIAAAYLERLLN